MYQSLSIYKWISSKQHEKNSTRTAYVKLAIGYEKNKTNPQQNEFNWETPTSKEENQNSISMPVEENCYGFIKILLKNCYGFIKI